MMRAEMRVGRLLEVRALLPIKVDEIPALQQAVRELFERTPGLVVAILDARGYGVEPPEAADSFLAMIRRDNPQIERSAFLVEPEQKVVGLQLERLIREAGNPNRRLFRDAAAAAEFLRPCLTPEESARLNEFLAEAAQ